MSVAELKELDDKSLVHRELQLERELMDARFRNKTGQHMMAGLMKCLASSAKCCQKRVRLQLFKN